MLIWRSVVVTAGIAAFSDLSGAALKTAQNSNGHISGFSKSDHSVIAEVRVDGRRLVLLNVATSLGQSAQVVAALTALGASVRFREDDVGYVSAVLPIGRVNEASRLPDIVAANVDMTPFRMLGMTQDASKEQRPPEIRRPTFPAPGRTTPRENPFLPARDIGAPQFITEHPTFDGRGVTIAIVDTGVDILSPELQTATTLDGRQTRKIVDWLNPTDPVDMLLPLTYPGSMLGRLGYPYVDSTWVDMRDEITAGDNGEIVSRNGTYRAPSPGRYRIGLFDERQTGSFVAMKTPNGPPFLLEGDVNRDGNPPGSSGLFGVLWNETTNEVWVDTNQNHSFADERAMTDYGVRFDFGTFGEDDPWTAVRETLPFVIQTDRKAKFVGLGITHSSHGTGVAGVAAGRDFFNGAFDGVAPGAQIVSMMHDGNVYQHNIIESLIKAAKHPRTDIITLTTGAEAPLQGEHLVSDIVVNRLIDRYGKPIVVAAMNSGPGMVTVSHPSAATKAISVGGYTAKETWLSNLGARVKDEDYLLTLSSRGPRGDGALKPDIVAPANSLSTMPALFDGINSINHFALPPGYWIGSGTSFAAPSAAGAVALLMSAARQRGMPADAERLKLALVNSARFLPTYGAHEQGSGLVQVGAAWKALEKLRDLPPRIVSEGPVRTAESGLLEVPDRGPGLYEREGWSAGRQGARTIGLTRTSGANTPVSYDLRWLGNDGTFQSGSIVTLPLNARVEVPVKLAPATSGVHSAILQIVDRPSSLAIHQVLTTIVAADDFDALRGYTITRTAQARRPGSVSHFLRVPAQVPVFNVAVLVKSGTLKMSVHDPAGRNVDSYTSNGSTGYQGAGVQWSRAFERPQAGVWEVIITNSPDTYRLDRSFPSPLPAADYTMRAQLLGADVSEAPKSSNRGDALGPIVVVNRFGMFTGALKGCPLGTARSDRPTLTREAPWRIFDIAVPPGTDRLLAEIDHATDARADLDLYLFDCTDRRCKLRASSIRQNARERVAVHAPAAGSWKVVVDAFDLPAGTATVEYHDVLLHEIYGRLEVIDTQASRAMGTTWQALAAKHILARPQINRTLIGFVDVIADDVYDLAGGPIDVMKRPVPLGSIPFGLASNDRRGGRLRSLFSILPR